MNPAESFHGEYHDARRAFLGAAREAGGAIESVTHPVAGPDGRPLAADLAWFGPRAAEAALVLISGTHGVEGFCGSGVQVDLLRNAAAARLPRGVAMLMIHAVNPYGFAWCRRVTHENVDLNRNWVDFTQPLPANPGYEALSGVISPAEWDDASIKARRDVEAQFIAAHGPAAFGQAASGGQYAHPNGIHFGGHAPTWSRLTQAAALETYLGQAGRIGIIDIHSGLGPWGYGERIVTRPPSDPAFQRAVRWFGQAVTSLHNGSSSSGAILGDGLSAAPGLLPHAEVTAIALEFGTLAVDVVHEAVCGDAWLGAHGDLTSPLALKLRSLTRDAFYVDADSWKGMVAGQARLAVRQAAAALRPTPSAPPGA